MYEDIAKVILLFCQHKKCFLINLAKFYSLFSFCRETQHHIKVSCSSVPPDKVLEFFIILCA